MRTFQGGLEGLEAISREQRGIRCPLMPSEIIDALFFIVITKSSIYFSSSSVYHFVASTNLKHTLNLSFLFTCLQHPSHLSLLSIHNHSSIENQFILNTTLMCIISTYLQDSFHSPIISNYSIHLSPARINLSILSFFFFSVTSILQPLASGIRCEGKRKRAKHPVKK